MKRILRLAFPVALSLAGCGKSEKPAAVAAATPAPVFARRLAPEGVFFVTQRLSNATRDGVSGVAPGTRVQLIRDDIASYHVKSDAGVELDIPREQLTNDLETVALLERNDPRSQAELTARLAAERADVRKADAEAQALYEAAAKHAPPATPGFARERMTLAPEPGAKKPDAASAARAEARVHVNGDPVDSTDAPR